MQYYVQIDVVFVDVQVQYVGECVDDIDWLCEGCVGEYQVGFRFKCIVYDWVGVVCILVCVVVGKIYLLVEEGVGGWECLVELVLGVVIVG